MTGVYCVFERLDVPRRISGGLARTFGGAVFYLVPAANVTGQAGVPARCAGERVAAVQQRLAHSPRIGAGRSSPPSDDT